MATPTMGIVKQALRRAGRFAAQHIVVIGVFVLAVATILILFARAADTDYTAEAEHATRSGGATVVSDGSASGQQALKFTAGDAGAATIVAVSDVHFGVDDTDRNGTVARVKALAANANYVIMAGDLVYDGIASQYALFDEGYGSILAKLRPSPGNHDNYTDDDAASYNSFFTSNGVLHGTKPDYWYSYDAGPWHIVSLNTGVGNSTADYSDGSEQLQWLESDLVAHAAQPTLMYFHAPRYTGSNYSNDTELQNSVKPIWKIALAHHVEVVVNGHDHSYQRFAPMDEAGNKLTGGVREFIAATGCYSQRNVDSGNVPNLEKWSTSTGTDWCGALQLKLYSDRYEWQFINNAGDVKDSGSTPVNTR